MQRGRGRHGRGAFEPGRGGRGRGRGAPQPNEPTRVNGGGGRAVSLESGKTAMRRLLQNLSLQVEPGPRLTPDDIRLAKRPDRGGKAGHTIEILANFFLLHVGVDRAFHYDVTIEQRDQRRRGEGEEATTGPQLLPMNLCRSLLQACGEQNSWPPGWAFDGKKNLYAADEIFSRHKRIYEVRVPGDGEEKLFEVAVKWASTISMIDIQRFLQRGDIDLPREAVQTLEVCLRSTAANRPGTCVVGRSIFSDSGRRLELGASGAEVWPGYHQGIKLCEQGLAVNVEFACAAFHTKQHVIDLLITAIGAPVSEWTRRDAQDIYAIIRRVTASKLVRTTHTRNGGKKHRCRGLTRHSAGQERFELKDGTEMSVEDYWRRRYGPLRYPWLPCLDVSRGKKVTYLPIEVCEIVPGQRIMKLSDEQTREMIKFTARPPEQRKQSIRDCLRQMDIERDPIAEAFGIQVNNAMIRASGRVLPPPYLQYGNPECLETGDRGAWNLEDVKFFIPGKIESWSIVSAVGRNVAMSPGEEGLKTFTEQLMNMLVDTGLTIPNAFPPLVWYRETTEQALKDAIREAESHFKQRPDIILYLLPNKDAKTYQEVKRVAEKDLGVITQCFVASSAGIGCRPRGRLQYLANLSMKINHKVGGINTQIAERLGAAIPVIGARQNKPFIVFGADVTHPSGFDTTGPSVGAVVASMDAYLGQFAARVLTMEARQEKMSMAEAMVDLFMQFYRRNKVKPEAIFFYRDGVSEGQFHEVLTHEYTEIRKACFQLDPRYNPPITLIVVQKMHHTRIFPANPADADRNGNVKPGTCVDTGITSKYEFDFYLNSHAGIQGTNKAAHYYVLVDENGFGSDGIQLFSYWMCYLYCRCTRSVSYAPPAYYAHLAALHGRYLVAAASDSSSEGSNGKGATIFHENLNERMFFV